MLQRRSYAPYRLYGHHGRSVTSNDWLNRYLSNSATRILSAQHVSVVILLSPLVADRAGSRGKIACPGARSHSSLLHDSTSGGLPHVVTRIISIAETSPLELRCGALSGSL